MSHPHAAARARAASRDPRYARLFGVAGDRAPLPLPVVACEHAGSPAPPPDGKFSAKDWRRCDHPNTPLGPVVCPCSGCGPRCPGYTRFAPVRRRRLALFVLPVSGRWRRLVSRLADRADLFDGGAVVAVATGRTVPEQGTGRALPIDPPDVVRAALPPHWKVIEAPNDPDRWEGAAWPALWPAALAGADEDDAVLYAHAKGVTRPAESSAHRWADLLYAVALDHWPLTGADLERFPVTGPMRKPKPITAGRTPGVRLAPWHYSGNVWWARCGPLADALARVSLPVDPWSPEGFAGRAWPLSDAGTVWSPAGGFDLYRHADMRRVETEYRVWAATRATPLPARPAAAPRLSVILPTTGRPTLGRALASITHQLRPGDEVIVRPDQTGDWGATPRMAGIRQATGDYLLFMDDDDYYTEGAFDAVRRAIAEHPGRPLMFRMRRGAGVNDVLWADPVVRLGNVSTQMIVTPNVAGRIGEWGAHQAGDHTFIRNTLALYPPDSLVWREEVIAVWRPDS